MNHYGKRNKLRNTGVVSFSASYPQVSDPDFLRAVMPSPVGKLMLVSSSKGLHRILWEQHPEWNSVLQRLPQASRDSILVETQKQLTEYFQKKRKNFSLPLVLEGTAFQRQAWQQLLKIPYGETITYGEQAARLGNKNKARAVGLANRLNPLAIIVPCHRVVGSNGQLVGFAGGLERKAFFLQLEQNRGQTLVDNSILI